MSIYTCTECQEQLDGDHSPCFEYDEKEVCEECYHKLVDMFGCHDAEPAYTGKTKSKIHNDWDMKNSDYL